MQTHDIGRLFWGITRANVPRFAGIDSVHLNEYPYHRCDRAVYLHLAPGRALVLGIWKPRDVSIHEHLLQAVKGRNYVPEKKLYIPGREDLQEGSASYGNDGDIRLT